MCIRRYYNSGSRGSATMSSGIHSTVVCAGHPHCPLTVTLGTELAPKGHVFSGDLKVLRACSDSDRSGNTVTLLTSVLTFIKCVSKLHREGAQRGLGGGHMWCPPPRMSPGLSPPPSDQGFLPRLTLSALSSSS